MPRPHSVSVDRVGLCTADAPVPLAHVAIRAEIRGAQATVTCVQQYRNQEQQPIEAVYVFPLDEGAAVCGFAAVVGDVRYEAEVKPRDSAFAAYDDAMAEGHGAFLLDEERSDVFTASIGNLAPGADAQIELTYVTELMFEGDAVRFMLPTTVSPRYAPAVDRVGIGRSAADALNPPSTRHVPYGLTFTATVHAAGGLRRIESPSHPVAVDLEGQQATVTLSQQQSALDRDLVLLITPVSATGPQVALERSPSGRIAASVTFRPSFAVTRAPADVVFLVDRSGSMQGSSIEQVRNALQLCLRSLESGCAFDLVGFGSSFESLFGDCRAYDEQSLADAHRHVSSLSASLGGTELLPALEAVLGAAARRERVLQLIVLTDGQVTNTDAVLEAVRRCRDRVRVFTFGIGRGASHQLVKGLARAGGGAAEFIYPGERIEAKVMRQFARALAPSMTDMKLDWGTLRVTTVPSRLGPVFADEPLRTYAWLDEAGDGVVTLRGRGPGGPVSWALDIRRDDVIEGSTIGTLTARARIREIEEGGEWSAGRGSRQRDRKSDRVVSEIVQLAMEYGLASRETSLVAIEKREVPTTQGVVLRRVPIAITSGWGGDDPLNRLIGADLSMEGDSVSALEDVTGEFFIGHAGAASLEGMHRAERAMPKSATRATGWLGRVMRQRPSRGIAGSEVPSPRALDRLIALQHADGSWDLEAALADVIGVPLKELDSRLVGATGAPHDIRRAWATALALTYLAKRESDSRQEWTLLAQKASRWLEGAAAVPPIGTSWLEYAARELV